MPDKKEAITPLAIIAPIAKIGSSGRRAESINDSNNHSMNCWRASNTHYYWMTLQDNIHCYWMM
jgi:hypothetical protein